MKKHEIAFVILSCLMIAYFLLKEDKQSSCIVINVLPDKYEGVLIESNSSIHPKPKIVNDTCYIIFDKNGIARYNFDLECERENVFKWSYKDSLTGNLKNVIVSSEIFYYSNNQSCKGFNYFSYIFTTSNSSQNLEVLKEEQDQVLENICN
jgi:hypothetical protein